MVIKFSNIFFLVANMVNKPPQVKIEIARLKGTFLSIIYILVDARCEKYLRDSARALFIFLHGDHSI